MKRREMGGNRGVRSEEAEMSNVPPEHPREPQVRASSARERRSGKNQTERRKT